MATTTEAQVCNLALLAVGQREPIQSLTEQSTYARVCNTIYGPTRDKLLSMHAWSFATKRAVLALTTEERTDYTYAFAVPANYLGAPCLMMAGQRVAPRPAIPFKLEPNDAGSGLILLTDYETPELAYTVNNVSPALFSPAFVHALASAMAVQLAPGLAGKPQLIGMLRQLAQFDLETAIAIDRNAVGPDIEPLPEAISVR